jgi:hypothetical protein
MSRDRSLLLFQRKSLTPALSKDRFRATGARCLIRAMDMFLTSDQELTPINFSIPEWGASVIHRRPTNGRGTAISKRRPSCHAPKLPPRCSGVARPPKDNADQARVAWGLPGCVPAR